MKKVGYGILFIVLMIFAAVFTGCTSILDVPGGYIPGDYGIGYDDMYMRRHSVANASITTQFPLHPSHSYGTSNPPLPPKAASQSRPSKPNSSKPNSSKPSVSKPADRPAASDSATGNVRPGSSSSGSNSGTRPGRH